MIRRLPKVALICLALAVTACDATKNAGPKMLAPTAKVVLAPQSDTVDAQPPQLLIVEARDADGRISVGTTIQFSAVALPDAGNTLLPTVYVCQAETSPCTTTATSLITDNAGRASVRLRFGTVAGRVAVRFSVPAFSLVDSASFTITAGAATAVHAITPDTVLTIGRTALLRGRVTDRYGNVAATSATVTVSAGSAITLDATSGVVTARETGTQFVYARYGALVDSTYVGVVPDARVAVTYNARDVRLINLDGSAVRTVIAGVQSYHGPAPRFDDSRSRVTLQTATDAPIYFTPNTMIVVDTLGLTRRDIPEATGFTEVVTERLKADGTLLVVGRRGTAEYALWRVTADNTIVKVATLPGLGDVLSGSTSADISPDGTRVVYSTRAFNPANLYEMRVMNAVTGTNTLVEPFGKFAIVPRWSPSGTRIAFKTLAEAPNPSMAVVINADGTGRREIAPLVVPIGHPFSWSPDENYLVGGTYAEGLSLLRVSDGLTVRLRFRNASGISELYNQPDWR